MVPTAFFEDQHFAETQRFAPSAVFRRCTFAAGRDGEIFEGAFHACGIAGFDWFQPFFIAVFVDTDFRAMRFLGASFQQSRFVGCTFEACHFGRDAMRGACDIDRCSFLDCTFLSCEVDAGDQQPFGQNRWYGCTQVDCRGFEGLF